MAPFSQSRRAVLSAGLAVAVASCHPRTRPRATLGVLTASRQAVHAYGRAGDLVLRETAVPGAVLTLAATVDRPGHRPLRGALLDASVFDVGAPGGPLRDVPDPLLWWRPAWVDARWNAHPLVATEITRTACLLGDGVHMAGTVDGVSLSTRLCPAGGGVFRAETTAVSLPPGARLGDELVPGTSDVLVQGRGTRWEDEVPSHWLVLSEHGTALVFGGSAFTARRRLVHIASEAFPAPVVMAGEGRVCVRTLRVLHGDVFDGLTVANGNASGARAVRVHAPDSRGGWIDVLDDHGTVLAGGVVPGQGRSIVLPLGLGTALRVRDADGVPGVPVPLPADTVGDVPVPAGRLRVTVTDPAEAGVPVHVLVRAMDGGDDPEFRALREGAGAGHAAGRSVYLLDGHGTVGLRPGYYRVTASRGPGWTLVTRTVAVTAGAETVVTGTVRRVTPPEGWIAADLHLHAAPSPDARVSLAERVASLACNGIELAVATDHNRITDYAPSVASQGLGRWLVTVPGDEVTSAGSALWGHFNAFPLAAPDHGTAPEDAVPGYYNRSPVALFAGARAAGATVLQVNHPRMPPSIGYFDLTHLDARTGAADPDFAPGFDAVEAFNGIWLESPERVREGARDLVALARRGLRVTATGNSDSHRLLYEEAGYPRTWVQLSPGAGTTVERTLAGLRAGATVASSGPFVELTVAGEGDTGAARGVGPGGTVRPRPDGTVRVAIRVTAPGWVPVERVEVWVNGVVAWHAAASSTAVDGVRYEGEAAVRVSEDALVMAWAEATQPLPDVLPYADARAIGFTTPVGVDSDGDGRVVPPAGP